VLVARFSIPAARRNRSCSSDAANPACSPTQRAAGDSLREIHRVHVKDAQQAGLRGGDQRDCWAPDLALYHFMANRIPERGAATGWQRARPSEESDQLILPGLCISVCISLGAAAPSPPAGAPRRPLRFSGSRGQDGGHWPDAKPERRRMTAAKPPAGFRAQPAASLIAQDDLRPTDPQAFGQLRGNHDELVPRPRAHTRLPRYFALHGNQTSRAFMPP
jgi:hypothetical protein